MACQVVEINCPGCGARVSIGQEKCEYCGGAVAVSTFNSIYSMPLLQVNKLANSYSKALAENPEDRTVNNTVAMCWLKLKNYDKALPAFEKAMEDNFDNSETYFYAAVCLLRGKKAFLQQRPTIDKIEEYLNAAIMIEPRGIYYYFLSYIKYDYFSRKFFKTSPTYQEAMVMARKQGYSPLDAEQLFAILGVERPNGF